jgi:hypothetical protein
MARTTMAALIDRVRRMIHDPAGTDETWTDDELQDWLDAHREDVVQRQLGYAETIAGGAVVVLEYAAKDGHWERDAVLADSSGAALTPDTADYLVGRWAFAAHQAPPVFVTGKSFDVYAAAADALEASAAMMAVEYDFSAEGRSFQRSQQGAALLALARQYRGRSRARVVRMVRDDVEAR